jgi:hypothetical protein
MDSDVGRAPVMIHHEGTEGTKDTKGSRSRKAPWTRTTPTTWWWLRSGMGPVLQALFVSFVPFVPSW